MLDIPKQQRVERSINTPKHHTLSRKYYTHNYPTYPKNCSTVWFELGGNFPQNSRWGCTSAALGVGPRGDSARFKSIKLFVTWTCGHREHKTRARVAAISGAALYDCGVANTQTRWSPTARTRHRQRREERGGRKLAESIGKASTEGSRSAVCG